MTQTDNDDVWYDVPNPNSLVNYRIKAPWEGATYWDTCDYFFTAQADAEIVKHKERLSDDR